jgi:hypothetical protein
MKEEAMKQQTTDKMDMTNLAVLIATFVMFYILAA